MPATQKKKNQPRGPIAERSSGSKASTDFIGTTSALDTCIRTLPKSPEVFLKGPVETITVLDTILDLQKKQIHALVPTYEAGYKTRWKLLRRARGSRVPYLIGGLALKELGAFAMPGAQKNTLTTHGNSFRNLAKAKDSPVEVVEQTAVIPWTKNEVLSLWEKNRYETMLRYVVNPLADETVINQLEVQTFRREAMLSLFSAWVEIAHQQAFRRVQKESSPEQGPCVLYLSLDEKFMPEGKSEQQLAYWADQSLEQAQLLLKQLHHWATRSERAHALGSLGWLVCLPNRPGLILCWDELLPQARYQRYWTQGIPGEVLTVSSETELILKIVPNNGPPKEVSYIVQGFEAKGLEARDKIRYWEDVEGQPLILSEKPLSPYLVTGQRKQNRQDDYAYELAPISIG